MNNEIYAAIIKSCVATCVIISFIAMVYYLTMLGIKANPKPVEIPIIPVLKTELSVDVEGFKCYLASDEMVVDKEEYEVTVSVKCSYNLLQSWFRAEGGFEPTGKEFIEPNGVR